MNANFLRNTLLRYKRNCRFWVVLLVWVLAGGSTIAAEEAFVRVQMVNATATDSIAVDVNGREHYPDFPVGLYTADGKSLFVTPRLKVRDLVSKREVEQRVELMPRQFQTLVITGDFSLCLEPDRLPQPGEEPPIGVDESELQPNLQFTLFSHALIGEEQPVRIRVFNTLPGRTITIFDSDDSVMRTLKPGEILSVSGRKAEEIWGYQVDGEPRETLFVAQSGMLRNVIVYFYYKNERLRYKVIFENTDAFIAAFDSGQFQEDEEGVER